MEQVTAAAVQATPVYLDREATVDVACERIAAAAANGARIIVFGEAFVAGYPDWVWRRNPHHDAEWFRRFQEQAVVVPSAATDRLAEAARDAGAYVVIGIDERDADGSTIYNSLLYLGPDGQVLGVHRKLMPTGGERLVWGVGDGSGLLVFDTPYGRLGGLICWENYMPLARMAMYAQGVDILAAPTWDNSDAWVPTLRHIGKEGRIHVIGATSFIRGSDVRDRVPGFGEIYRGDDDVLSRGNSAIVNHEGEILAGPLVGEEGIVHATLDVDAARASRRMFDPVGHYARPDVFKLSVDRRPKTAVTFEDADPTAPALPLRSFGV